MNALPPLARACVREATPTIVDALDMWSSWHGDASPLGSTGNYALDTRLADAFRMMLYLGSDRARFRWIEREVFSTDDFPSPAAPADPYRSELIRWHCALYAASEFAAA